MALDKIFKNRGELLFLGASLIASGLNYLAYPVMGRLLEKSELASTINALTIVTVMGGIFASSTLVGLNIQHRNKGEDNRKLLSHSQAVMLGLMGVVSIIVIAASPYLSTFLYIGHPGSVILSLIIVYLGTILGLWIGYFNGAKFYRYSAILIVLNSFLQLIFLFVATYVYRSEYSPLFGFLIGTLLSLMVTYLISRRRLPVSIPAAHIGPAFTRLRRYIILCFTAFVLLWIGQSFDVIAARSSLSKYQWIEFTLVSLYPRILYFLGFSVIWIIVSKLSDTMPDSRPRLILRSSLIMGTSLLLLGLSLLLARPILDDIFVGRAIPYQNVTLALLLVFKALYSVFSLLACTSILYAKLGHVILILGLVIFGFGISLVFADTFTERLISLCTIIGAGITLYSVQLKRSFNEKIEG